VVRQVDGDTAFPMYSIGGFGKRFISPIKIMMKTKSSQTPQSPASSPLEDRISPVHASMSSIRQTDLAHFRSRFCRVICSRSCSLTSQSNQRSQRRARLAKFT